MSFGTALDRARQRSALFLRPRPKCIVAPAVAWFPHASCAPSARSNEGVADTRSSVRGPGTVIMATVKRIVCLANSRKLSGRCTAGRELVAGKPAGWIRPVSRREHEEVSEYERQYDDGSDPRVGDIIDVPLIGPRPREYQQENWLLDPTRYWKRAGRAAWDKLTGLADVPSLLWINGKSTTNGQNDIIPLARANTLKSSLRLVRVERLTLEVFKPGEAFGNPKRRVQGRFLHKGATYRLWVTDPHYEQVFLARPDGKHELGECLLTISLGEPFNDACYKLIAAIIERREGVAA